MRFVLVIFLSSDSWSSLDAMSMHRTARDGKLLLSSCSQIMSPANPVVFYLTRRTPLHCAASCNNLKMVEFLVEHGASVFATTFSDHETACEKCDEEEPHFDACSQYLYSESFVPPFHL